MKNQLTEIPYPTSAEEEYRWGFDLYPPVGTPRAWIVDWDGAAPGFSVSESDADRVLTYQNGTDLNDITVDEIFAAHSMFTKQHWHSTVAAIESVCGAEDTASIATELGRLLGIRTWELAQSKFGENVSIERTAWHQDIAHLLSGCGNQAYAWFDDEKMVVARTNCFLRPPDGMEATATYCRDFDDAHIEAYMAVESDLLIASIGCCCQVKVDSIPDGDGTRVQLRDARMGEIPTSESMDGGRAIHLWTYSRDVISNLPDDVKAHVSPSMRNVLAQKGCDI